MDRTLEKLQFLTQKTQQNISFLLAKATELGIEQLWI